MFRTLLAAADEPTQHLVESTVEALGFGFFVPVFFINTGLTFDLEALTSDARALLMLPVYVVLLLVVRGLPGTLAAPSDSTSADRRALALFSATALPIIVAVTDIAVDHGELEPATAASVVGAGMVSVLLFPLLGLRQRQARPDPNVGAKWSP